MLGKRQKKYAEHGIQYKSGKILSPIGWINELLKVGNDKTGKKVLTFSLLPGVATFAIELFGFLFEVIGTCICSCAGCYAQAGRYIMDNVKRSLSINTLLVNKYLSFVNHAIRAQLELLETGEVRIHAAGDFNTINSDEYAKMWHDIAADFPNIRFWTYTKISKFENLFDGLNNANIVKSVVPHVGINYGTCEYVINAYYTLRAAGVPVYVCRCGIDKKHHCENCGICSKYKYVLFVEHSTKYNAEKDPLFPALCEIIENQ